MATPKTAWPTEAELTAIMVDLGVTQVPSGITLESRIESAIAQWHGLIEYSPFLAGTADDYLFSPPFSKMLILGCYFATVTAVEANGVALAENEDYWLIRRAPGDPVYAIKFRDILIGDPNTVQVTGSKGWSDEIPFDAWVSVANLAAAEELERIAGTSGGMVKRTKLADMEVEYAVYASSENQYYSFLRKNAAKTAQKYSLILVN